MTTMWIIFIVQFDEMSGKKTTLEMTNNSGCIYHKSEALSHE